MEDVIRTKILRSPLITCCYSEDREVAYLNVHNTVHDLFKKISSWNAQFARIAGCVYISKAIQVIHSLSETASNRFI